MLRSVTVAVPYRCPTILFGLCPAAVMAGRLRRRRWKRSPFACLSCGYDLRATPDRCPECGAMPKAAKAKA
ncbi:MAG TPA: hypothetical protein VG269_26580 [Tepidisphaeraceae bacterium]|jgi:hypothetical protein|nr:hypothetical protein [Tepidisphaeraceae bacterium]